MLVIGHKAPMEVSAIACRIESLNQRRRAGSPKQVSGPQRCRPHAIPACDPNRGRREHRAGDYAVCFDSMSEHLHHSQYPKVSIYS
jgi:hypothetical protein